MKDTLMPVLAIGTVAAVAVVVHLIASMIDWPWAIALGAAVAVVLRAVIDWRGSGRTARRKTAAHP